MRIEQLIPGSKVDNDQLSDTFGCSPQGGMRRSHKTNTLVIISNHVKSIYDDRWDNGTLHYTGMGTKGDQSLDFAQNKTLAQSNTNGIAVHLFEVFRDKEYTYVGLVQLAAEPYQEAQTDENGNTRLAYVFPLKLVSGEHLVTMEDKEQIQQLRRKKAAKLSDEELKYRASQAVRKPGQYKQLTVQHERNVWVSEFAKRRAGGICQLCLLPAPFKNTKREPYLETHHIEWLAKGGDDTIENTVALCPNCHRKMHIVNDEQDIKTLKQRLEALQ
ncbi:HNH endonuclease [Vibrio parahaemolyticus]|uniref:HNH endonuclease n=1 Tax=Vibrio parahaemolyticus TaxID=670 RepID=UPI0015944304|nr:HNH endonuclease [Vibrio parahaemolyticus]EKA7363833.1 HNH endonuclease [Vibrio parahaemolyticus]NVC26297.1 HNH endonuclease [Vibrio parahaemolyticus]